MGPGGTNPTFSGRDVVQNSYSQYRRATGHLLGKVIL